MADFRDFRDLEGCKDFKNVTDLEVFTDFKDFTNFKDFEDFGTFRDFKKFRHFSDLKDFWGHISAVVAATLPSTVLAQDHFYSDFCGLPLTFQTQA